MLIGKLLLLFYSYLRQNPATKINYSIPKDGQIKIVVYNLLGSVIKEPVNEEKISGKYEVNFDIRNLPSGIYFYKIISGEFSETKKMILIKQLNFKKKPYVIIKNCYKFGKINIKII
ncbi:MAG: T9SS type A sorting domain-containing protein [Bacteroidetes bacterium]|nr:T9SS type A sorting domain-containing protein [Bacteroidota bacterium]